MLPALPPLESDPKRVDIGYAMVGLPAREELLFKNLVRLLDGTSKQRWLWRPDRVEMWAVCAGAPLPFNAPSGADHHCVLAVGEPDSRANFHLKLPMRVNDLRPLLDAMGETILASRLVVPMPAVAVAALPVPGLTPAAAMMDADETARAYRLKVWPRPDLIGSANRLRVATLLVGQATLLPVLAQRAGLPAAECRQYLQVLEAAGFLEIFTLENALATIRPAHADGLPGGVRGSTVGATGLSSSLNSMPLPQNTKLSLFQRIRNRLSQTAANHH